MTDISNKALAALVLVALGVVLFSTIAQVNRMHSITGLATTDTGDVSLTIAASVNIEVDSGNNSIAFGTCTPLGVIGTVDSANSTSNTSLCDGAAATGLDSLQVNNIGNVDVNVTVQGECAVSDFIPENTGTDADFQVRTNGTGCVMNNISSYTTLTQTGQTACENLTQTNSFFLWAEVTIPPDANQSQNCGTGVTINTLQFNASQSGV